MVIRKASTAAGSSKGTSTNPAKPKGTVKRTVKKTSVLDTLKGDSRARDSSISRGSSSQKKVLVQSNANQEANHSIVPINAGSGINTTTTPNVRGIEEESPRPNAQKGNNFGHGGSNFQEEEFWNSPFDDDTELDNDDEECVSLPPLLEGPVQGYLWMRLGGLTINFPSSAKTTRKASSPIKRSTTSTAKPDTSTNHKIIATFKWWGSHQTVTLPVPSSLLAGNSFGKACKFPVKCKQASFCNYLSDCSCVTIKFVAQSGGVDEHGVAQASVSNHISNPGSNEAKADAIDSGKWQEQIKIFSSPRSSSASPAVLIGKATVEFAYSFSPNLKKRTTAAGLPYYMSSNYNSNLSDFSGNRLGGLNGSPPPSPLVPQAPLEPVPLPQKIAQEQEEEQAGKHKTGIVHENDVEERFRNKGSKRKNDHHDKHHHSHSNGRKEEAHSMISQSKKELEKARENLHWIQGLLERANNLKQEIVSVTGDKSGARQIKREQQLERELQEEQEEEEHDITLANLRDDLLIASALNHPSVKYSNFVVNSQASQSSVHEHDHEHDEKEAKVNNFDFDHGTRNSKKKKPAVSEKKEKAINNPDSSSDDDSSSASDTSIARQNRKLERIYKSANSRNNDDYLLKLKKEDILSRVNGTKVNNNKTSNLPSKNAPPIETANSNSPWSNLILSRLLNDGQKQPQPLFCYWQMVSLCTTDKSLSSSSNFTKLQIKSQYSSNVRESTSDNKSTFESPFYDVPSPSSSHDSPSDKITFGHSLWYCQPVEISVQEVEHASGIIGSPIISLEVWVKRRVPDYSDNDDDQYDEERKSGGKLLMGVFIVNPSTLIDKGRLDSGSASPTGSSSSNSSSRWPIWHLSNTFVETENILQSESSSSRLKLELRMCLGTLSQCHYFRRICKSTSSTASEGFVRNNTALPPLPIIPISAAPSVPKVVTKAKAATEIKHEDVGIQTSSSSTANSAFVPDHKVASTFTSTTDEYDQIRIKGFVCKAVHLPRVLERSLNTVKSINPNIYITLKPDPNILKHERSNEHWYIHPSEEQHKSSGEITFNYDENTSSLKNIPFSLSIVKSVKKAATSSITLNPNSLNLYFWHQSSSSSNSNVQLIGKSKIDLKSLLLHDLNPLVGWYHIYSINSMGDDDGPSGMVHQQGRGDVQGQVFVRIWKEENGVKYHNNAREEASFEFKADSPVVSFNYPSLMELHKPQNTSYESYATRRSDFNTHSTQSSPKFSSTLLSKKFELELFSASNSLPPKAPQTSLPFSMKSNDENRIKKKESDERERKSVEIDPVELRKRLKQSLEELNVVMNEAIDKSNNVDEGKEIEGKSTENDQVPHCVQSRINNQSPFTVTDKKSNNPSPSKITNDRSPPKILNDQTMFEESNLNDQPLIKIDQTLTVESNENVEPLSPGSSVPLQVSSLPSPIMASTSSPKSSPSKSSPSKSSQHKSSPSVSPNSSPERVMKEMHDKDVSALPTFDSFLANINLPKLVQPDETTTSDDKSSSASPKKDLIHQINTDDDDEDDDDSWLRQRMLKFLKLNADSNREQQQHHHLISEHREPREEKPAFDQASGSDSEPSNHVMLLERKQSLRLAYEKAQSRLSASALQESGSLEEKSKLE